MSKTRIVILGAGFAGLQVARHLKNSDFDITVIDQYNFHQFQPLFYQVATARLEPSAISFPLRKVFQQKGNVHVRMAHVKNIDTTGQRVVTDEGTFDYDELVIATGCTTNFFGNKNIEQYAYPMKSTPEAIALRNRLLMNFEDALAAKPEDLAAIMNIVIVGGGPTGVELAGAFAEMKTKVLPKDYPDMDFSKLTIYLVEGQGGVLINMSKASQAKAQEYLENMGVQLMLNTTMQDYDGKTITFKDGKTLPTHTLVWAAGVTGNVPEGIPKEILVRGNRMTVDEYNRVKGLSNVYAIGDVAYMENAAWPKGHPQLANVAVNQGRQLAANLKNVLGNKPMQAFTYKNPGTMATVGKSKAVVDLPKFSFQGFFAWLTWMFLHLMLILSVKNKLIIFIEWATSYITNDTTLRLVLLPTRKQVELAMEHHEYKQDPVLNKTPQP
ncbi:MAG: NAD(P)/FAD-dependent oxidoreductase [Taibaiella sp.]|nr:NAD(P)/FAD-dependent oxidoreductase [Taibaiella sp.]